MRYSVVRCGRAVRCWPPELARCPPLRCRLATLTSWTLLWLLAHEPDTGMVRREDVRCCYNGTLFYRLAEARRAQRSGSAGKWE